jgi:glycerol kinase
MSKYILSIDSGTTSCRAILFDKNVNIRSVSQREFTQIFPQPGWVEHDANEIWSTQFSVIQEAISKIGAIPKEISAFGITNQRETTVVWNKNTGKPVYNAIVWQDRRTADYCKSLVDAGKTSFIKNKTGLVIDSYFSATKIKWILDNVPGARSAAEKGDLLFGTIDTWLIWNLTRGQVHATDPSNASRTMIYNIVDKKWDDTLLELFGIPKSMLPEVRQSSGDFGAVSSDLLPGNIKIAGVAGDQQAATFGQACLKPGMAKNTYGTGCFMLLNIGRENPLVKEDKILTTIAWGRKGHTTYALEGSVFVGGAVVQWVRDGLGLIQKSSDIEALANQEKDNGGVYLVPAFVGLGAPHWDSYARGTIVGLTRGSNKSHIARAALESIAFQSYDVLQAMAVSSGTNLKELRVDGGASLNNTLMQFQADILNKKVVRPTVVETTALGVAYLAGLFVEFWASAEEIEALWKVDKTFEPHMSNDQRDDLIANWQKAISKSKGWVE